MKKIIVVFLIIILAGIAYADWMGYYKTGDNIRVQVFSADTLGRDLSPDSVHLMVNYQNEATSNSASYTIRYDTAGAGSAIIDSFTLGGVSYYYLIDAVADIDNDEGAGNYTADLVFFAQGEPFHNRFSFGIVDSSVNSALTGAASVPGVQSEVANIDGWNPITDNDSLVIDISSISSATPDVNVASVDSGALESVDFEDHFLKESKIDSGAITEAKIADVAFDSAKFSGDYWNALSNMGGTASIPDSIAARIDSILVSLGYDASTSAHDKIDNLSLSGGGSEPETLIVLSSPDSTLIGGASIVVRTIDQSTVKVDGLTTDHNGRRILELDADSFFVALTHNNYTQTLDTLVIQAGGGTDSLWMNEFDPGNPSFPDLCRVYGWVYDISGGAVERTTITAEIPSEYHPVQYNNVIITPFRKNTESDSSGYWQIDLFPNSLLSKTDSKYLITIEYASGVIFKTETAVPDSSSWQLQ